MIRALMPLPGQLVSEMGNHGCNPCRAFVSIKLAIARQIHRQHLILWHTGLKLLGKILPVPLLTNQATQQHPGSTNTG